MTSWGVPQDTVLAPLLFLMYKPMTNTVSSQGKLVSCADDGSVMKTMAYDTWQADVRTTGQIRTSTNRELHLIDSMSDQKILVKRVQLFIE